MMIELPLPPGVERQIIDTPLGPVTTLHARPTPPRRSSPSW